MYILYTLSIAIFFVQRMYIHNATMDSETFEFILVILLFGIKEQHAYRQTNVCFQNECWYRNRTHRVCRLWPLMLRNNVCDRYVDHEA